MHIQKALLNDRHLYLGATNLVLQLSTQTLKLVAQFKTGPDLDNANCAKPFFCLSDQCTKKTRCVPNYNKLLVAFRDVILACGTMQRKCYLLQAVNVSLPAKWKRDYCDKTKDTFISIRNKSLPMVASIYETKQPNGSDFDLLYVGGSNDVNLGDDMAYSMTSYFLPGPNKSVIENIDQAWGYLPRKLGSRFVYSWTTSTYGFIMWTDGAATRIARYCHQSLTNMFKNAQRHQIASTEWGKASYVEVGLECTDGGAGYADAVSAEHVNGTLYVLFAGTGKFTVCEISLEEIIRKGTQARRSVLNNCSNVDVQPVPPRTHSEAASCRPTEFQEEKV